MIEALTTADQVFDALGGNPGVAELTAGKPTQISNWRSEGSFPPKTYCVMRDALRARRKKAPDHLWRMISAPASAARKNERRKRRNHNHHKKHQTQKVHGRNP